MAITGGPRARALTNINSPANDVTIEVTDGLTIVDNAVDISNISNEEIATYLGQEVVDLDDRGKLLSLFNLSHLEEEQRSRLEDIIYTYRKVFSAHQYDVGHTDAFEFPINTVPDWQNKFVQDKPRPFSPKDRRALELWSKILLKLGKIEPSCNTLL